MKDPRSGRSFQVEAGPARNSILFQVSAADVHGGWEGVAENGKTCFAFARFFLTK